MAKALEYAADTAQEARKTITQWWAFALASLPYDAISICICAGMPRMLNRCVLILGLLAVISALFINFRFRSRSVVATVSIVALSLLYVAGFMVLLWVFISFPNGIPRC